MKAMDERPTRHYSQGSQTTRDGSRQTVTEPLEPFFVSVKQAAELLAIAPSAVYQLLDQQRVESRYIGRRRLVSYVSLKQFAESLPTYYERY